jgi:uncharacterized protein
MRDLLPTQAADGICFHAVGLRGEWQFRVETHMRLTPTGSAFPLQGSLRAFEGANEVCRRDWDRSIPQNFL